MTYANGTLAIEPFASGAMIESVVRRGQKLALKRHIAGGPKGLTTDDLLAAVGEEFKENEDLPNTTNPDDWAKISGRKRDRILAVRLVRASGQEPPRELERVSAGQYLEKRAGRGETT